MSDKMKKKLLTAIFVMGLIFNMGSTTAQATVLNGEPVQTKIAQEKLDKAESTDFSNATQINIANSTLQNTITETCTERLYKFNLSSAGRISLDMTSYMQCYTIVIYDNEGTEIWYTDGNKWNTSLQYRKDTHVMDLSSGLYYMKVTGYEYNSSTLWKSTGNYILKTSFSSANESFKEFNNEFSSATSINANSTLNGQISLNDTMDIFHFSLSTSGSISLDMTSYMQYYTITIYDSAGTQIWYTDGNKWNENLGKIQNIHMVDLASGLYYMKVTGYEFNSSTLWKSTGNYTLKTSFASASESFSEPNNDFSTAIALPYNTQIKGQIALNDDKDNFILNVSNDTELKLAITSYMKYYTLVIYDSAGKQVWKTSYNKWDENVGYRSDEHRVALTKGKYYLKVTGYENGESYLTTGTYQLKVSQLVSVNSATVDKIKDYAYTRNYIKPTATVRLNGTVLRNGIDYVLSYKNNYYIGTATVYINGIGDYTGETQATFNIVPKKVSLSSVKNTGKKKATVKWKYDSSVTGYQIYRSTKKNSGYKKVATVKSSTTSKTISKLKKGKKYYFKVRAYTVSNGKKYYGEFSKVKSVKIKK